jgi:hypothetical protein
MFNYFRNSSIIRSLLMKYQNTNMFRITSLCLTILFLGLMSTPITNAETPVNPISDIADITSGTAPLTVTFTVPSGQLISGINFISPGTAPLASLVLASNYTYTYESPGIYNPLVSAFYYVGNTEYEVDYTGTITVTSPSTEKTTPTITWNNPADITYETALSSTQLNAEASVPGSFSYNPDAGTVLSVGTHILHVDFTPDDNTNYNTASKDVTINVQKITPTITWSNPADITYGTVLSSTQLDATASVPGTFAYNPPAGTLLSAGTQTLHVDFTPTDTTDYNTASKDVTITVNQPPTPKLTPTITWTNPDDISYGTALSDTQLNAKAKDPTTGAYIGNKGTFTYTPSKGTKLSVGTQTLHVDFTPTDKIHYNTASKDVTINVLGNIFYPGINWTSPDKFYDQEATLVNAYPPIPSYEGTDMFSGALQVYLASINKATAKNLLDDTKEEGSYYIAFAHSGGTRTLVSKIEKKIIKAKYVCLAAPALISQDELQGLKKYDVKQVVVFQSKKDMLNILHVTLDRAYLFNNLNVAPVMMVRLEDIPSLANAFDITVWGIYRPTNKQVLDAIDINPNLYANQIKQKKNLQTDVELTKIKGSHYLIINISPYLKQTGYDSSVLPENPETFWIGGSKRASADLFADKGIVFPVNKLYTSIEDPMEVHRQLGMDMATAYANSFIPFNGKMIPGLKGLK